MLRRRTTGWIGFDVGGSTVKTAQAVRVGSEFRIRTAAIVSRRERWNPDALTADEPRPSADEMQAAASVCDGLSGRAAAAVLPMVLCDAVQVECREDRLCSEADLTVLVEGEMHQSLEGYVLGSWPAHLQTNRSNVVVVPGAWSNQISDDIAAGRWNCRRIEALPWALVRAVGMCEPSSLARPAAALDWGDSRATLTFIYEGAPAFVRCLKDCGFQHAVAAVESAFRLPALDAAKVLRRHGLGDPSDAATVVAEALAELLHRLENEIRRTLSYWHGQSRGVKPETMYLFGGGASLAGLATRLASTFDLTVQTWDLPTEHAADADRLPPAHLLGPALAASALAWEGA